MKRPRRKHLLHQISTLQEQLRVSQEYFDRLENDRKRSLMSPTHIFSDMDKRWIAPVARIQQPGVSSAWVVMVVEAPEQWTDLKLETIWSMVSADPYQHRLEGMNHRQWAAVRAYPLNDPRVVASCPTYHTEEYVLGTLSTFAAYQRDRETLTLLDQWRRGDDSSSGFSVRA